MTTTCINPTAISDGDLIRYVDGEAEAAVVDHVRRCPACAREAQSLGRLQAALLARISPTADLEKLRQVYKPDGVRILFVGESPPAGQTFFYKGNSNLCRYTQEAFSAAFGTEYEDAGSFLIHFWRAGCYLDDLCLAPVNHLTKAERRAERKRGVGPLAERMAAMSPRVVVVVMKGIALHVQQAVKRAGLTGVPLRALPFPAMGHQAKYVAGLAQVLRDLRMVGVLG
jgi:hypothetical protein